jgi:hypothetical protein
MRVVVEVVVSGHDHECGHRREDRGEKQRHGVDFHRVCEQRDRPTGVGVADAGDDEPHGDRERRQRTDGPDGRKHGVRPLVRSDRID